MAHKKPGARKEWVAFRVTPKEREEIRRLGGGNITAAVRDAIQLLAENRKKQKQAKATS